jgi:hypothetical protein
MPVGRLLASMSSAEFTEWLAYDSIEPIGSWRDDARFAMLCALIASAYSDPKKGRRPTPEDFLPWLPKSEPEEPDPEVVRLQARLFKQGFRATKLAPGEKPPGWTGEIG